MEAKLTVGLHTFQESHNFSIYFEKRILIYSNVYFKFKLILSKLSICDIGTLVVDTYIETIYNVGTLDKACIS